MNRQPAGVGACTGVHRCMHACKRTEPACVGACMGAHRRKKASPKEASRRVPQSRHAHIPNTPPSSSECVVPQGKHPLPPVLNMLSLRGKQPLPLVLNMLSLGGKHPSSSSEYVVPRGQTPLLQF
eukprot:89941-Chlamydomonas_euryale.AAC.1